MKFGVRPPAVEVDDRIVLGVSTFRGGLGRAANDAVAALGRRAWGHLVLLALVAAFVTGAMDVAWASTGGPDSADARRGRANAVQAPKAPISNLPRPVSTVEGISEYRLSNGLQVLLAPDASKPTITVNMTYKVGSLHENYGETGMAHLLEHLLFKGSPAVRNVQAELAKRGIRSNGTTWLDRTNYFGSFPADEATLRWMLDWQADVMVNAFVAKRDLDSEMPVVRNEMEAGENSPFRVLYERASAVAYQWHNYGKSTIGARSDVENVDIARLRAFYRKYYQPDNAVLVVSGKFDPARTLEAITRSFGKIPKPRRVIPPTYTLDPVQDGERSVTVRRVGAEQWALAMYHVPPGAHPDAAAVELLPYLLADAPSGRLHRALVDSRLASSVFGLFWPTREPGTVTFAAKMDPAADLDKVQTVMLETLEGLGRTPFTEEEFNRARLQWLKQWELNYSDPEEVGVQLSDYIAKGDWRLMFLTRDRIKALKLGEVQRVATQYLLRDNRTFGRFVPTATPQRAPAPARVDVAAQLKDFRGDPDFVMGEAFDPTPANIERRTQRVDLPNGMKLVLLPKRTRGGLVNGKLVVRTGSESSLQGQSRAAAFAASLLLRGTPTLSRQQIADRFDALGATVDSQGSAEEAAVTWQVRRTGLEPSLELIAHALREADFPAKEFDELQQLAVSELTAASAQPEALGSNRLARHANQFPKGDPRYVERYEESIAATRALKREQVRDFHRRFYGAEHAILTLVGDFDPERVKALVQRLFADWKAAERFQRLARPMPSPAPIDEIVHVADKANAYLWARSHFPLQDTADDYPALLLANFLLGRADDSRLWMRIREQDGLSYGVGTSVDVADDRPSATWTFFATMAPENLQRVRRAFDEELKRALKDGFTEDEVARGRQGLLRLRYQSRAHDAGLAGILLANAAVGRDLSLSARVDARLAKLTAAEVNAALRRYLKPESLYFVASGSLRP